MHSSARITDKIANYTHTAIKTATMAEPANKMRNTGRINRPAFKKQNGDTQTCHGLLVKSYTGEPSTQCHIIGLTNEAFQTAKRAKKCL